MFGTRAIGCNHIYIDEGIDGYSNVAAGLLVRAVGHGLKVAYVDLGGRATKFSNFLENLSLSYDFVRRFDRLYIEIFTFRQDKKVSKTIIPMVEFYTITREIFWNSLKKFDLVIFDNFNPEMISPAEYSFFLERKDPETEIVSIFQKEEDAKKYMENADLISAYKYKKPNSITKNKNIIVLTGDGKGKSTYGFGFLLRKFMARQDVKLIYFDKGGDFYGERVFFEAVKRWAITNNLYGTLDFAATGMKRFNGRTFRFENTPEDIREAKEGLALLKTSLKKQTPVIAEELNTTVRTGLLKIEEIMPILNEVERELLITGRYAPNEIISLASILIEVEERKHYSKSGMGVRKGIDF